VDKKIYNAVNERADGCCEVCGKYGGSDLELHHILRRKVPATVENTIMLCVECHRGTKGVHGRDGHILDLKLKLDLQKIYFDMNMLEAEVRYTMGGKLYD
jgi:5-methylcytosine-specific restriction endonuclease McrA